MWFLVGWSFRNNIVRIQLNSSCYRLLIIQIEIGSLAPPVWNSISERLYFLTLVEIKKQSISNRIVLFDLFRIFPSHSRHSNLKIKVIFSEQLVWERWRPLHRYNINLTCICVPVQITFSSLNYRNNRNMTFSIHFFDPLKITFLVKDWFFVRNTIKLFERISNNKIVFHVANLKIRPIYGFQSKVTRKFLLWDLLCVGLVNRIRKVSDLNSKKVEIHTLKCQKRRILTFL